MSLNDMHLPPTLLTGLYRQNLAEIQEGQTVHATTSEIKTTKTAASLKWLGKNKKGILLLVDYENELHLPDAQLNFLSNILQACRLNLEDVAILNFHQQKPGPERLSAELPFRQAILFGVDPSIASLPTLPPFAIHDNNGKQWLSAPPIEVLNDNSAAGRQQKATLWTALKQLFGI